MIQELRDNGVIITVDDMGNIEPLLIDERKRAKQLLDSDEYKLAINHWNNPQIIANWEQELNEIIKEETI